MRSSVCKNDKYFRAEITLGQGLSELNWQQSSTQFQSLEQSQAFQQGQLEKQFPNWLNHSKLHSLATDKIFPYINLICEYQN